MDMPQLQAVVENSVKDIGNLDARVHGLQQQADVTQRSIENINQQLEHLTQGVQRLLKHLDAPESPKP